MGRFFQKVTPYFLFLFCRATLLFFEKLLLRISVIGVGKDIHVSLTPPDNQEIDPVEDGCPERIVHCVRHVCLGCVV